MIKFKRPVVVFKYINDVLMTQEEYSDVDSGFVFGTLIQNKKQEKVKIVVRSIVLAEDNDYLAFYGPKIKQTKYGLKGFNYPLELRLEYFDLHIKYLEDVIIRTNYCTDASVSSFYKPTYISKHEKSKIEDSNSTFSKFLEKIFFINAK